MPEKQNADKVKADLQYIMLCFKEVLTELKEDELANSLPWIEENTNSINSDKQNINPFPFNCLIWLRKMHPLNSDVQLK